MKGRVSPLIAAALLIGLAACATPAVVSRTTPGSSTASAERLPDTTPASDARFDTPYPYPATAPRTEPPSPTPCEMAAPTTRAALVTGGTLPATPSIPPTASLGVLFGLSPINRQTYDLSIIDTKGHVLATARASLRSPITGTCGNDSSVYPTMPLISASAGRVYFLDGDTDVRYLAPDGSTGLAARLPGSSQSVAMFSVSPDDKTIAVAVFDYRSHPVATHLYLESLGGGYPVNLPASYLPYSVPLGWHDGKLLVGTDATATPQIGFYAPLPEQIWNMQLLDPSTGNVLVTFGDASCRPNPSLPSSGGIGCWYTNLGAAVIDWSGKTTVYSTAELFTGGVSVSPDGNHIATAGTGGIAKVISSPATGGAVVDLGLRAGPAEGGWLDTQNVVMRGIGTSDEYIVNVPSKAAIRLPSGTILAARIPEGF